MPLGLQLVQVVLCIAGVLNLIGAVFFAKTTGIPLAIGCAMSFVLCVAASELIVLAETIRANTSEIVKHQRFQSSVLDAIHEELRSNSSDHHRDGPAP